MSHCYRLGFGPTLVLGTIVTLGCHSESSRSAPVPAELPVIPVATVPLERRSIQRSVSAVGSFSGFDELALAPKVDGRVQSIAVDVGDPAIPGAILLELDPTDYALAVAEARRAFDVELARLGLAELPTVPFDVDSVPAVRRARVSLENAATRYHSRQELFERKVLAKEEFELAETEFKLAEATYRDAVTQAEAVLAMARYRQATLRAAEERLRECQLRVPIPPGWAAWAAVVGPGFSPVRYTVAQRLVSEGHRIVSMPVTEAFRLVIDHVLKLRVSVPERYTAEIQRLQPVEIRVDAYPREIFRGQVSRIHPTVDPQNRTFQVEIVVPNLDGRLRVGGFARAEIQTRVDDDVATVPSSALVSFAGVTKIFLTVDGVATPVEVLTGHRERDWVEVIGELPKECQVIVSGLTQLVAGSPVRDHK